MKLDKPLMVASGSNLLPRIVRALLLVLIVVIALALLAAAKPWKLGVPMPEWNLKQCIRVSLWWAGLLALPPLVRHAGLKSRMPQLFWPIVAVITILYTTTAAPRLRQSLWDDEIYAVRKIVLGTDRIGSDGSVMITLQVWFARLSAGTPLLAAVFAIVGELNCAGGVLIVSGLFGTLLSVLFQVRRFAARRP